MMFYIQTMNDSGSGMKYKTKEEFMKEIGLMIDDCIANGGTFFSVDVDADASCFYQGEDNAGDDDDIAFADKAEVAMYNDNARNDKWNRLTDACETIEQTKCVSATYISIWDTGAKLGVPCKVNMETKAVFDIELDADELDEFEVFQGEKVLFADGREYPVYPKAEFDSDKEGYWHQDDLPELGNHDSCANLAVDESNKYRVFRKLLGAYVNEAGFDDFKEALEYCSVNVGNGGYAIAIENQKNQAIVELKCHGGYTFDRKHMTNAELTVLEDFALKGEWHH